MKKSSYLSQVGSPFSYPQQWSLDSRSMSIKGDFSNQENPVCSIFFCGGVRALDEPLREAKFPTDEFPRAIYPFSKEDSYRSFLSG